jgi:hypothetical protein
MNLFSGEKTFELSITKLEHPTDQAILPVDSMGQL